MSELPQDGPGADLKEAREGMDVSTREVADALNLPVHVIEALEADDYERLPPTVFTRGYLRSYARLLELSPEGLLARYPEVTEEMDAITGELPVAQMPAGSPAKTLGIAAAVGVVLILLLVLLLGDDEAAESEVEPIAAEAAADVAADVEEAGSELPTQVVSEPAGAAEGTVQPQPAPARIEPEIEQAQNAEPRARSNEPAAAEPIEPTLEVAQDVAAVAREVSEPTEASSRENAYPKATDQEASGPEGSEEAAASDDALRLEPDEPVSPSFRERRITEFGDDTLTFVFSEDCWVEVKSLAGENLYSDLNRTGRTLVLTGRAPFRILLGYAPGVTLSFNGDRVPLERYSRNNVANLVLGE